MGKEIFRIVRGTGDFSVELVVLAAGRDLQIILTGGDSPHIGAVAISIPRPSLTGSGNISSTTSNFTFPGHKDDEIARSVSHRIASSLNTHTVVSCGIHLDNIDESGISLIRKLVDEAVTAFLSSGQVSSIYRQE